MSDAERQRQQNEELQNKLRSEHRMAEDIKSEKEQLRQQVSVTPQATRPRVWSVCLLC